MVLKEIQERFSVRNFLNKQIPEEVIKEILEAGRLAPSWINTQPWHFIVVRDAGNKTLLSQLAHGQKHVENAPVVIVCCGDKSAWEKENFRDTMEKRGFPQERIEILLNSPIFNPTLISEDAVMARTLEELTYSIAYMTLEAKAHGVESCIVGAIGNDLTGSVPEVYELTKKTLDLPEDMTIMTLLLLGYPAETTEISDRIRKSFDEVVSYEIYGG